MTRLSGRIAELEDVFGRRAADLRLHPAGAAPEEVLVLEIAGDVTDFVKAVNKTEGMEWLVESGEFEIDPDEDFSRDEAHPDEPVKGRLFLVMTNQEALRQLRTLWLTYEQFSRGETPSWPRGRTKWRDLFAHLRDIRYWGPDDRLRETGLIEDWAQRVAEGAEEVPLEIELWFRRSPTQRDLDERTLRNVIESEGGRVINRCLIQEIHYHALLARVPVGAAQNILNRDEVLLVRSNQVMFLRPVGQTVSPVLPLERGVDADAIAPVEGIQAEPIVALLDGLPLENHFLLQGRLIIDDPDDWSSDYQVQDRMHGTNMASIIVHGDLTIPAQSSIRPVYVRPITKPVDYLNGTLERIPDNVLVVDLIHSAVRRLYHGQAGNPPVAPSIRIINYSLGDTARPFDTIVSPLARLLDWLAWTYGVLFVVSAGNCPQNIHLGVTRAALATMAPEQRDEEIIRSLWNDALQRRVLSPAEGVNVLTVAATHTDLSTPVVLGGVDMLTSAVYPSPINPLGFGFRRSIKPELLAPGGRQPYRELIATGSPTMVLSRIDSGAAPGIKVAAPSPVPGDIRNTTHTRGTSNATAAVTHTSAAVHDMLRRLTGGTHIDDHQLTLLTKAVIVHSARWPDSRTSIARVVGNSRQTISRFLGYGELDSRRALSSSDQRATLVGWGRLPLDDADIYSIPLPPSLSGQAIERKLTITLAWFTPTNHGHQKYRGASLRIEPIDPQQLPLLQVDRSEADRNVASRGTLQHEVLTGSRAALYDDGATLAFRVACKPEAVAEPVEIPYAIAITLEIPETVAIPVYTEIETRIRTRIEVVATT